MKKGLLLVMATAFISGFSIFINKFGITVGTISAFTFLKVFAVALLLAGLFLRKEKWAEVAKLKYKSWLKLVIIGLVGGSVPFLLFFKGLSLTSAVQGGLIHKTMFLYAAILAVVFLKEKISWRFILGALLIFTSNIILLKNFDIKFGTGDILVFGATLLWAIENIISKSVLKELSGSLVAWGRMFFGAIFIFIYLAVSGELSTITYLSFYQVGWVLITSVLLFGYVITWYSGLKNISVSTASAVLLMGAVITTLLSAAYAGKLNQMEIVSSIIALAGFAILIKPFLSSNEIKLAEKKYQGS